MKEYNKMMLDTLSSYIDSLKKNINKNDYVKQDLESILLIVKQWIDDLGDEE